VPFMR